MKTHSLFRSSRMVPAGLLSALVLAAAPNAHADTCSNLSHPVYVAGSSAVKPYLALIAKKVAGLATPITVVYQSAGSCTGVAAMDPAATALTGTGTIWDPAANSGAGDFTGSCDMGLAGPMADVGVSDVFPSTCTPTALPADVHDFVGPVQAMTFAVPTGSTQHSISAEAAYLVYGFGSAGEVSPWSDDTLIYFRDALSGTQNMLATAIKVPAAKWKGTGTTGSGDIFGKLTAADTAGNGNKTIGILSADYITTHTGVRALAYQHYGQDCGYYPDSGEGAPFDKANVRDGHYAVWGALHLLSHTPPSADVQTILDYITLSSSDAALVGDLITAEAKAGVVPDCAMRVKRTSEIGPMMSYMPAHSCECKFVKEATGTAPANCQTCDPANNTCPSGAPACNFGFCEVQ